MKAMGVWFNTVHGEIGFVARQAQIEMTTSQATYLGRGIVTFRGLRQRTKSRRNGSFQKPGTEPCVH